MGVGTTTCDGGHNARLVILILRGVRATAMAVSTGGAWLFGRGSAKMAGAGNGENVNRLGPEHIDKSTVVQRASLPPKHHIAKLETRAFRNRVRHE